MACPTANMQISNTWNFHALGAFLRTYLPWTLHLPQLICGCFCIFLYMFLPTLYVYTSISKYYFHFNCIIAPHLSKYNGRLFDFFYSSIYRLYLDGHNAHIYSIFIYTYKTDACITISRCNSKFSLLYLTDRVTYKGKLTTIQHAVQIL